jgi:multidrug efflux system membrane fusion protein
MAQEDRTLLDLDRIFHYKDLSDKNRKIAIAVCMLVFSVGMLLWVRSYTVKPPKEKIPSRIVQTAAVIQKDAPVYITSFGTLTPISNVDITSQVTGEVKEVHFTEGDEVSEGDLLFVIDPRPFEAELEKAKAALAEDLADLKLKADTVERNRSLVEEDLISEQNFEEYQTEEALAEAKVQLDYANVELAKINLDYCYIRSPIHGLTGKRLVDPGNIVPANTGPALVNIKSYDPLYIDFTIPERDLDKLRKAMAEGTLEVKIEVEGGSGGPYTGGLHFLDNTVDDMTGTVSLRAIVPNKDKALWAGQFVRVRLILSIKKNATLAPYEAVRIGQKGPYLFVVTRDNKADLRLLTLAEREDDYIVVEEGVKPGERVVTSGQLGLSPGVSVIDVTQQKARREKAEEQKKKKGVRR